MQLDELIRDEAARREAFPVCGEGIFLAHAGVAPLPRVAVEALHAFARLGSLNAQENQESARLVRQTRADAAELIGADADEISLLGPTSLGLSLVARGLDWARGDEVVYHADDYPANVYPWLALQDFGVSPVPLNPEQPGVITWEVVEAALSPRTKLVALASCHFLSGYRIDVDGIGRRLHERGVLFCVDAIQTLGAFPLSVEHVDFLSADSHKWLLGPCGAGIFYVKRARQADLRPALLGAWNVSSPDFIAQPDITLEAGGRRYEPGALNLPGIYAMQASLRLLLDFGVPAVGRRLLDLRRYLLEGVRAKGYELHLEAWDTGPAAEDAARTAIVSIHRPGTDMEALFKQLLAAKVTASLRRTREGRALLRFSPHGYNSEAELDRVLALL